MKKMLAMLLAMMACALPALGEEAQLTQAPEAAEATEQAFTPTDSNILVACFSATGNTWPLAEYAADYLNADLFRIEPEVPYTEEDLNYNDDNCRANQEMNDENARPALAATVENMDQYDTVIIGFPKMEQGYICV